MPWVTIEDEAGQKARVYILPMRIPDGDVYKGGVRINADMHNSIVDTAKATHRKYVDVLYMWLSMGRDLYRHNGKIGITTSKRHQQEQSVKQAQAEAAAARRAQNKKSRTKNGTAPALSPLIFGDPGEVD